jgi:hypothetical protein
VIFSGVILSIFDCLYIVIFGRFIYLYRDYLDSKKKDSDNSGNFDEIKDLVKDTIDDATTQIKKGANFIGHQVKSAYTGVKDKLTHTKKENSKENAIVVNINDDIIPDYQSNQQNLQQVPQANIEPDVQNENDNNIENEVHEAENNGDNQVEEEKPNESE